MSERQTRSRAVDENSKRPSKKARVGESKETYESGFVEQTPMNTNGSDNEARSAADSHIDVASAIAYWSGTSADVTGMLGGYPQVSRADLQGSSNFLAKLRRASKTHPTSNPLNKVADCGAGIGRITLGFLSKVSNVVDIVEPVAKFTQRITEGDEFRAIRERGGIGQVYNQGLETWEPSIENDVDKYDLIWNQWCLGQLTDNDLVKYLKASQTWLTPGGWIIVKENLSNNPIGEDVYDETDSSVTRTDDKFRAVFEKAGLKLVSTELQKGFPKDLYPVRMYAMQPTK